MHHYVDAIWNYFKNNFPGPSVWIAICAFVVAAKNYRRKSGISIRETHTVARNPQCEDAYVSEITLENLKDRTISIFAIYLRLGLNNYLEIQDFKDSPLLLKGYETLRLQYGPLEFYHSATVARVHSKALFGGGIRSRVVLSTSEGRYMVPSLIRKWSPIDEAFKFNSISLISPYRFEHNNLPLGSNTRFIVEVVKAGGVEQQVLIDYEGQCSKPLFGYLPLPFILENKQGLTNFLEERRASGNLDCISLNVIDLDERRIPLQKRYYTSIDSLYLPGRFRFYVLDKVDAWWTRWKTYRAAARANDNSQEVPTVRRIDTQYPDSHGHE